MKKVSSSLLSSRIRDIPRAIFKADSGQHTLALTTFRQIRAMAKDGALDETAMEMLSLRPEMLADMVKSGLIPAHQRRLLLEKNPACTFRALMADYDGLCHEMEAFIIDDLESVERLVQVSRLPKGPELLNSVDYYQDILAADPNRLLRVIDTDLSMDERDGLEFARRLADEAYGKCLVSAGWAFYHLRTTHFESIGKALADLICTSDEYCYLTAKLCRHRNIPTMDWSGIANSVKSPRWAYHMLRDGLTFEPEVALNILKESPPWLVEHMETSQMRAAARDEMFQETYNDLRSANKLAFLHEYQLWFSSKSSSDLKYLLSALAAA